MQRLRLPFVITVTTASACGGNAVIDGNGAQGAGGSGGATPVTVSAGPVSATGNVPSCPPTAPDGYTPCDPSPSICSYDVPCQSGVVSLGFQCTTGYWEMAPAACVQPYDSCPGTEYYCDGSWWMPNATNPPSPCPSTPPVPGSRCYTGGMGGVWEHCGYYCPDHASWTVATCVGGTSVGQWAYDHACEG